MMPERVAAGPPVHVVWAFILGMGCASLFLMVHAAGLLLGGSSVAMHLLATCACLVPVAMMASGFFFCPSINIGWGMSLFAVLFGWFAYVFPGLVFNSLAFFFLAFTGLVYAVSAYATFVCLPPKVAQKADQPC